MSNSPLNEFPHLRHMSELEREKLVDTCMPPLFGLIVAAVITVVCLLMAVTSAIAKFYGASLFLAFVISTLVGGGIYIYLRHAFIYNYLYKKTLFKVQNR